MSIAIGSRLKHAWNAFMNKDPTYHNIGPGYSYRPDGIRLTRGNERSIITSVYNRIALDCATTNIEHVRLDDNNRFVSVIDSSLNNCLTLESNIDQTAMMFIQDVVMSMLDEGCVAIVPVDTSTEASITGAYDIETMRTGKILEWYPMHVKVWVYNDRSGRHEELVLHKRMVGIIENPFYAVMNERNSTMQRLIRKINLLDTIDDRAGSDKLDLIIQLPYATRAAVKQEQAKERMKAIEDQLANSRHGIAYIDSSEHVTQLNRSVENDLMRQIEYLTSMLYSQLGITQSIMDGTADDKTMLNYRTRTIAPILSAMTSEMKRKFLTKTARTQSQSIKFFINPFDLVPTNELSEMADKLTRNEIMTSNEVRQIIGMKPSDDPSADELRNKNLSAPKGESDDTNEEQPKAEVKDLLTKLKEENQNEEKEV